VVLCVMCFGELMSRGNVDCMSVCMRMWAVLWGCVRVLYGCVR
jgi:hypothetical protein